MIQIKNLTAKQVQFLDTIWGCETKEGLDAFMFFLNEEDKKLAESLILLVQIEMIDSLACDCAEAKEVLWRVMYC
jgi:hypothetical protein